MEIRKRVPTCYETREMNIVDYLAAKGHEPNKIQSYNFWYLSLLRIEKTPSFKVNCKLNQWYNHGIGKGGNLIDFVILYHDCTIGEFLQSLHGNLSFHKPTSLFPPPDVNASSTQIKILNSTRLRSLVLIRYLHSRKIPFRWRRNIVAKSIFNLTESLIIP